MVKDKTFQSIHHSLSTIHQKNPFLQGGTSRHPARAAHRFIHLSHTGSIMGKARILAEFWQFLRVRKKYWLAPIVIVLVLLSLLIVMTQGSALAPFIYALF
jgi:hypothetical protein